MKQRRTVKSLLPKKTDREGKFLMILLLILSIVLCIGSASLMTAYVGAEDNTTITYTGMDDKIEVLYKVELGDPSNLTKVVNEMYMSGENLYFTPYAVKEKPNGLEATINTIGENGYINILGGEGNEVYSDNITMIAGYGNQISEGNDNASILGGRENIITGNSEGAPAVIVGGQSNKIENNKSNVIVGGYNNEITETASNSTILGGESNEIEGHNAIVGGSNIVVETGISNVFVFSNKNTAFIPKSSNAFYLNLINGVGINVNSAGMGLSVKGKVLLGNIDIDSVVCNPQNLGVEGVWNIGDNGCLVGCTQESYVEGGKWELLDRGGACEEKCDEHQSSCLYEKAADIEVPDYEAFCLDNISVENTIRCTAGQEQDYKNVVFQTVLIDKDEECPENPDNKCVYKCNTGSHLTGNVAGGDESDVMCFKDCELPWGVTIMQNETVTGYNIEEVSCSNDIYVFPLNTEIINKGNPFWNYSIGTKTIITTYGNAESYPNRIDNGKSPETCGIHDHKKTLVCLSGTLYLTAEDGKTALLDTAEEAKKYNHETCKLNQYRCNTGEGYYDLRMQDIVDRLGDHLVTPSNQREDRGSVNGERGIYEVCRDYNAYRIESSVPSSLSSWSNDGGEQAVEGEACKYWDGEATYNLNNQNIPTEHYKFVGCQSGYDGTRLDSEGKLVICKKRCTLYGSNGIYKDGDEVVGYVSSGAACTDTCQSEKLVCNDGIWRIGEYSGAEATGYLYNYCNLSDKICSNYNPNITSSIVETYSITKGGISGHSYYGSCDPYVASGNKTCNPKPRVYKLTGCDTTAPGYHTENWLRCVPNAQSTGCIQTGAKGTGYEYISRNVDIIWSGTWDNGQWMWPESASAKCEWKCTSGYHYSTGKQECVSNVKRCLTGDGVLPEHAEYEYFTISTSDDDEDKPCPWHCVSGYVLSGNICVGGNECHGRVPENAYFITGSDRDLGVGVYNRWTYKLDQVEDKKCAYVCNDGYVPFNGDCVECPLGELDSMGRCIGTNTCPEGKPYLIGGSCYEDYGNCYLWMNSGYVNTTKKLDQNNMMYTLMEGKYIDRLNYVRPAPGKDMPVTCIDADDPEWNEPIQANTCTYKCDNTRGYYCKTNGDIVGVCALTNCNNTWATMSHEGSYSEQGFPWHNTFGTYFTPEEILKIYTDDMNYGTEVRTPPSNIYGVYNNLYSKNHNYVLEDWEIQKIEEKIEEKGIDWFNNIPSYKEFDDMFANRTGRCIHWCPKNNRQIKDGKYRSYYCKASCTGENKYLIYGYSWNKTKKENPVDYNENFRVVENIDAYENGCLLGCKGDGVVFMSGYGGLKYNSNTKKYYIQTGKNIYACYQKCEEGQIMNGNMGCKTCTEGEPINEVTWTVNGITYSEYTQCSCPEGKQWDSNSYSCKNKDCPSGMSWNDSQSKCVCDGGGTWSDRNNTCVVCGNKSKWNEGKNLCECLGGSYLFNNKCVCPSNSYWASNKCNCNGNSVLSGNQCVCPQNSSWNYNATQCICDIEGQTWNSNKQCACPDKSKLEGGECVCPEGSSLKGGICDCDGGKHWSTDGKKCISREGVTPLCNTGFEACLNEKKVHEEMNDNPCYTCYGGMIPSELETTCGCACPDGQTFNDELNSCEYEKKSPDKP